MSLAESDYRKYTAGINSVTITVLVVLVSDLGHLNISSRNPWHANVTVKKVKAIEKSSECDDVMFCENRLHNNPSPFFLFQP